ncbi:virion protein [Pseudoalteromonas xiamenensis]
MNQKTLTFLMLVAIAQASMHLQKPKGIRNNNPLNIKAGEQWLGLVGDDGTFAVFETAVHGIRAAGRLLRTYANEYKRNTIETIIQRWAPSNENNTLAYIHFVSDKSGIAQDKVLTGADYPKVLAAMIHMENGEQPYAMAEIEKGFNWGFYG